MRDFLHIKLTRDELMGLSMLALAHIGDAVFELMVRANLCAKGFSTAKNLHRQTVKEVSATAQSQAAVRILPLLTEEESAVYTRGRNAKVHTVPKGATYEIYHAATAFEALFGYLYLSGEYERLNELFGAISDS